MWAWQLHPPGVGPSQGKLPGPFRRLMATPSSHNTWQRPLLIAGSVVLVVAALSLARAVLIPIVLAVLLTFVLNPVVGALQRLGLRRIRAAIGIVFLAFCLLGGIVSAVIVQPK